MYTMLARCILVQIVPVLPQPDTISRYIRQPLHIQLFLCVIATYECRDNTVLFPISRMSVPPNQHTAIWRSLFIKTFVAVCLRKLFRLSSAMLQYLRANSNLLRMKCSSSNHEFVIKRYPLVHQALRIKKYLILLAAYSRIVARAMFMACTLL